MGFNESHSAIENVVVITGKLISPPYGLKAGLNSESHYQHFYFLLLLLCTPPPACLCLSFCFYLFLSTSNSLSPLRFFLICPLFKPHVTFLKPLKWNLSWLRSNCDARMGHDRALQRWPTCQEREPGMLWPLVNRPCRCVPQVWLRDWREKTPINLSATESPQCRGSQPRLHRESPQELLKEYWCPAPPPQRLDSELIVWNRVQTAWSISLSRWS